MGPCASVRLGTTLVESRRRFRCSYIHMYIHTYIHAYIYALTARSRGSHSACNSAYALLWLCYLHVVSALKGPMHCVVQVTSEATRRRHTYVHVCNR